MQMLLQVMLLVVDEMELGNQMATTFNDGWQACGIAMDQSIRPNGDLNRQVDFNMVESLEFDYNVARDNVGGDNVDLGGYGPTWIWSTYDLNYFNLAIKTKVALVVLSIDWLGH